jgi:hypothetical protein
MTPDSLEEGKFSFLIYPSTIKTTEDYIYHLSLYLNSEKFSESATYSLNFTVMGFEKMDNGTVLELPTWMPNLVLHHPPGDTSYSGLTPSTNVSIEYSFGFSKVNGIQRVTLFTLTKCIFLF